MSMAKKSGLDIKNPDDLQKIAERLGTLGGWGKLTIVDVDFAKKMARIRWTNGVSVRNRKRQDAGLSFRPRNSHRGNGTDLREKM